MLSETSSGEPIFCTFVTLVASHFMYTLHVVRKGSWSSEARRTLVTIPHSTLMGHFLVQPKTTVVCVLLVTIWTMELFIITNHGWISFCLGWTVFNNAMFVCYVRFKLIFITNPDIAHTAAMSDHPMNSFHVISNVVLPGSFEITQVTTIWFILLFFRFISK